MNAAARLAQCLQSLTPATMATVSVRAGVCRKLGARARAGRRIGAPEYLLLCSAVGMDVATGAPIAARPRAGAVLSWRKFGLALLQAREREQLDLRTAAR